MGGDELEFSVIFIVHQFQVALQSKELRNSMDAAIPSFVNVASICSN